MLCKLSSVAGGRSGIISPIHILRAVCVAACRAYRRVRLASADVWHNADIAPERTQAGAAIQQQLAARVVAALADLMARFALASDALVVRRARFAVVTSNPVHRLTQTARMAALSAGARITIIRTINGRYAPRVGGQRIEDRHI